MVAQCVSFAVGFATAFRFSVWLPAFGSVLLGMLGVGAVVFGQASPWGAWWSFGMPALDLTGGYLVGVLVQAAAQSLAGARDTREVDAKSDSPMSNGPSVGPTL